MALGSRVFLSYVGLRPIDFIAWELDVKWRTHSPLQESCRYMKSLGQLYHFFRKGVAGDPIIGFFRSRKGLSVLSMS